MNQSTSIMDEAQLNDIAFKIENAIGKGYCYITIYELTKTNRKALEGLGYTVKAINQYNEFSYCISW